MADPIRIELLEVVSRIYRILPGMRLGQLVCNLASLVEMSIEAVWTVEDAPLLLESEAFLDEQVNRLGLSGPSFTEQELELILQGSEEFERHRDTDFLSSIAWCLEEFSELRFGELIALLVAHHRRPNSPREWAASIWDISDEDLEAVIYRLNWRNTGISNTTTIVSMFGTSQDARPVILRRAWLDTLALAVRTGEVISANDEVNGHGAATDPDAVRCSPRIGWKPGRNEIENSWNSSSPSSNSGHTIRSTPIKVSIPTSRTDDSKLTLAWAGPCASPSARTPT